MITRYSRRLSLLLASLVAAGAFATFLVPPAQAADNGTWAATPTQKVGTTPRQFFFFELSDGQTIRDSVTVTNATEDPLPLTVYPADAFNIEVGAGFALRSKEKLEENNDVGTWIKVSKDKVTVPAGGSVNIPFTMKVPRGTTPGDHAGGIVTLEPEPPTTTGGTSEVLIQKALAVRTYVRVLGPLTPPGGRRRRAQCAPGAAPFIGQQGAATVTYTISNQGNTRITADREITLTGLLGRKLHAPEAAEADPQILPGSRVVLTESFAGMPVLDRVTARVEVSDPTRGELCW